MHDAIKCFFKNKYYTKKISQYVNSSNYHDLYIFVNKTAWFAGSSVLISTLEILEEQYVALNNRIWTTPTIVPKKRLAMNDNEYSMVKYAIDSRKEHKDNFVPNPQYQRLLFQKKRLDRAIKTINYHL